MIQAFSHIFNFFNIASPCGDMIFCVFYEFYSIYGIILCGIALPYLEAYYCIQNLFRSTTGVDGLAAHMTGKAAVQIFSNFRGNFEKIHFLSRNYFVYFWTPFRKIWLLLIPTSGHTVCNYHSWKMRITTLRRIALTLNFQPWWQ